MKRSLLYSAPGGKRLLSPSDSLHVRLAPGGGACVSLETNQIGKIILKQLRELAVVSANFFSIFTNYNHLNA